MADMPGQSLVPHHVRLLRVVPGRLDLLWVHMRRLLPKLSMLGMLGGACVGTLGCNRQSTLVHPADDAGGGHAASPALGGGASVDAHAAPAEMGPA